MNDILINKFSNLRELNSKLTLFKISHDETDNVFDGEFIIDIISNIVYASNVIYDMEFVYKDDKIVGISLSSYPLVQKLEHRINTNYFKKEFNKSDISRLLDLITILNANFRRVFLEHEDLLNRELENYIDEFVMILNMVIDTLHTMKFRDKDIIMDILRENRRFANEIQYFINKPKESKSDKECPNFYDRSDLK